MSSHKKKETTHFRNLVLLGLGIFCVGYFVNTREPSHVRQSDPFSQDSITIDIKGEEFSLKTDQLFAVSSQHKNEVRLAQNYLEQEARTWEESLGLQPAREGSLGFENGALVTTLPQTGISIDRAHLSKTLLRLARTKESKRIYTIYARTLVQEPQTSERDFKQFAESIEIFLSRDFSLLNTSFEISHTVPQNELPNLIVLSFNENTGIHEVSINQTYLNEQLQNYNREMQDAGFSVEGQTVTLIPARTGIAVDLGATEQNIITSIQTESPRAEIGFVSTEPEFTTEEAEALNINHLVSSFTTFYACCEARARNIQAVAKLLDGVIVQPGETFSLNSFIGRRTAERGFEPAGTIVKGSMIETVGGGISQFATTFYNAVYWGGYQDISHTPHSRYFSRYPEGIEATISWPEPHLVFKNNSENGILIKTIAGNTFVTVQFLSDNDGRILAGKHANGATSIDILAEGGEQARVVASNVSERTEIYPPKEVYYVDPLREPNAIFVKTAGRPSYSVDVNRTVTQGQETISQRTWKVFYLSEDKEFFVQSCDVVPEGGICKTQEDMDREKEELEAFFQQLQDGM